MAGKQSASRRVSASTTAPSAPSASSSHMNQKRCWPGVPNRYTTRSSRTVIRPKSIATVVVVFCSTPSSASTRTLGSLSTSSVRSGLISLTAVTSVVLPAPKPPAIRILIDTGPSVSTSWSEPAESISNILEQLRVGGPSPRWLANCDQSVLAHVRQQYPDHAERKVKIGGQVGDRLRPTTSLDYLLVLGFELQVAGRALAGRSHGGEQVDALSSGAGATASERIRPDDGSRVSVEPLIVSHLRSHRFGGAG